MRGVLEEEWLRGATFEGVVGEELSAVEESFVVHRMVASNIASKEHISRCVCNVCFMPFRRRSFVLK